jgi:hypothetical protein
VTLSKACKYAGFFFGSYPSRAAQPGGVFLRYTEADIFLPGEPK